MFSHKDLTLVVEDDWIDLEEGTINSDGYSADADETEENNLPTENPVQKRTKQTVPPLADEKVPAAVHGVNLPHGHPKPPVHQRSPSVLEYRLITTSPGGSNFELYPDSIRARANHLFFSSKSNTSTTSDSLVDSAIPPLPHVSQKPS